MRALASWTLPLALSVVVASPADAARSPLDVIVVVDTSSSMDEEVVEPRIADAVAIFLDGFENP